MVLNPYSQLAGPQNPNWTNVRAQFICEECGHVSTIARYSNVLGIVTWLCKNSHTNTVEDIEEGYFD